MSHERTPIPHRADGGTCARCGRGRSVGEPHRCPAPDLIVLRAVERQVLTVLSTDLGAQPLLVGGCVRDAVLGIAPKDIDIEVHGGVDLDDIEAALARAGFAVDLVGKAFGVLKVHVGGGPVDVSVPRHDSKIGAGHRGFEVVVDTTLDVVAASRRRDFTINTLMWDPFVHEVIDAHGGLVDLAAGLLRHTSEAFIEDPLRVLRGVQFAGRFGLEMHPDTVALCRTLVATHGELATERIWTEWDKIATKAVHPGRALALLERVGWMEHYPEITAITGVPQDERWHPEGPVEIHTQLAMDAAASIATRDELDADDRRLLVFGLLAHDFGKATHTQIRADGRITAYGHAEAGIEPTRSFLSRIGCPRDVADRVAVLVREHMCASVTEGPTPAAVRRLARRLGDVPIELWARVVEADNRGRGTASNPGPAGEWVRLARDMAVDRQAVPPLVTGRDLIDAGLTPGPAFKPILTAAVAAQDDGEIVDRGTALAWLARHLAGAARGDT